MKRMLITAAVLLTAVALMLSAGCAKDKKPTPETSDDTTAEAAISSTSSEKMTLPSNISGTEIKRGEKYDIPLDEAVKQMRECSKGFAEYVDSGMAIWIRASIWSRTESATISMPSAQAAKTASCAR